MLKTDTYNLNGEKSATINLPEEIFAAKINSDLIYQAVVVQMTNARSPIAHSKTRGEVSGSGRKPWRQKGTGRARVGDIRPPHWIGGGVAFGPRKDRNYSKKLPKKMRRQAIFSALADKLSQKKIIILEQLKLNKIKTKTAENLLQKLPIKEGTVLIVLAKSEPSIELSFQNLPYSKTLFANNLNIYDILKYDWLVTDKEALAEMEKVFLRKVVSKGKIAVEPVKTKNTNMKNIKAHPSTRLRMS